LGYREVCDYIREEGKRGARGLVGKDGDRKEGRREWGGGNGVMA